MAGPLDVAWAVAGLVLVASGAGLCSRARACLCGGLFACCGALLVVAGLVSGSVQTAAGVAAMTALAMAIVTYPRLERDGVGVLALSGVVAIPALAWPLTGWDSFSRTDLVWVAFALTVVCAGDVWWRLETAPPRTRSALLYVAGTSGVTWFFIGVVALGGTPMGVAAVVHASLGLIGVAALLGVQPGGWPDGRWVASRVAAWFFSLACLFATATLLLTVVEWWTGSGPGVVATSVAAALCGVLWNPLLRVVQRVSDGAFFGYRPDALTAAQRVAVGVGDDPTAAVRAIQEALVLPYVGLDLADEARIEVGTMTEQRRVFPIDVGGEHIGDLVVGIRPGDFGLSRDDERVITIALPILVQTVRARSQAASLRRARMAGAAVREEERRRLRRDLHDGLGPRLTGIAFTADAAALAGGADAAIPMLNRIRSEAESAIMEIRELVHGLRPPALDELGLVGALLAQADALDGVSVSVQADDLQVLPAAVEVAAYRIVTEALTNVARHSGATRAEVVLREDGDCLELSVADNGSGGGEWVPDIGLTSMRERARELGGCVTFASTPTGSTVRAEVPVGDVEPPDHDEEAARAE